MRILKRRSDAIYLTEMGAFIARRISDRTTRRVNETLFAPLFRLLPGNWKSIDARDVARAMLAEALAPAQEGVTILTSSQLREKAG